MPAQAVHKLAGSSYFTRCRRSVDKPIFFTDHSLKRLEGKRQNGITQEDVIAAARSIPGTVVTPTRFKKFRSAAGRLFDIVICDMGERRIIVTIIGKGG
jgi:hypothetical protein